LKITSVRADTLQLEYGEPFVIASSALAAEPCDLVRVETDEGLVGYGEADADGAVASPGRLGTQP
jgi:L-alanine-DL-glutamate epimerase-like enolase superfamily enzyme